MTIAVYARVSTDEQDPQRQLDDCREHVGESTTDLEYYVDFGESGAKDEREEFQRLCKDIQEGVVELVVTSEVSRISRRNRTWAEFIELCMENEVAVETADGSMLPLDPDNPISKFVAQLMSSIAELEREMILERINSGIRRAQREGKWTGRPPFGFTTDDDGYLVLDPDSYLRMQVALDMLETEDDMSLSAISRHSGVPKSSLSRVSKDDDRRKLYLYGESDDERVEQAVENAEVDRGSEVADLRERIERLETQFS